MVGRDVHRLLVVNLREREHWGDPDVDGKIILRWMDGRDVHRIVVGKTEGKRSKGETKT
jgi:hypothetical protein